MIFDLRIVARSMNRHVEQAVEPAGWGDCRVARPDTGLDSPANPQAGQPALRGNAGSWPQFTSQFWRCSLSMNRVAKASRTLPGAWASRPRFAFPGGTPGLRGFHGPPGVLRGGFFIPGRAASRPALVLWRVAAGSRRRPRPRCPVHGHIARSICAYPVRCQKLNIVLRSAAFRPLQARSATGCPKRPKDRAPFVNQPNKHGSILGGPARP